MRTNSGYWFRAFYSKGVNHHHLHLAETQSQAREQESIRVKKNGGSKGCSDWGCWQREAENSWLEVGIFIHWFGEHIWLSLASPELEVKTKNRKADHHWPSPDCLGLITAEVVGQNILSYMIWPLSVYIFSLSIHTHIPDFYIHFQTIETFIK